jgi:hypothetical protein
MRTIRESLDRRFVFAVCGIWGQRRGGLEEDDEGGGVNLDGRASGFLGGIGWGHGAHPAWRVG